MESLGLQTVRLSDGTTAYVQQAVKGECSGDLGTLPVFPAHLPAGPHLVQLSVPARDFCVHLTERGLVRIRDQHVRA